MKKNININLTAPAIIFAIAQFVFILLKVFGIIPLPWVLILLPTIILCAGIAVILLIIFIYGIILILSDKLG